MYVHKRKALTEEQKAKIANESHLPEGAREHLNRVLVRASQNRKYSQAFRPMSMPKTEKIIQKYRSRRILQAQKSGVHKQRCSLLCQSVRRCLRLYESPNNPILHRGIYKEHGISPHNPLWKTEIYPQTGDCLIIQFS